MIKVYKIEYPFPDEYVEYWVLTEEGLQEEVKRLSGLGVNVKWSEYNE